MFGYLVFMAVVTFCISSIMAMATYDDAKRYRTDKRVLRMAFIAMVASPLAGFWLPFAAIYGVLYGMYRVFRVAFKED